MSRPTPLGPTPASGSETGMASRTGAHAPGASAMKDEIRRVSIDLLVRHGYQGFRFRDVAEMLGTTRANIHHHYGNKANLCEEVFVEYVETLLTAWEANWRSDKPFADKVLGTMEANRERYLRYNPGGVTNHPWSVITRMRLEREIIGPRARRSLARFSLVLEDLVKAGLERAVARGELSQDIPRGEIALQLVVIADSAGAITQDGTGFQRLEQAYRSFSRIVQHAYAGPATEAMTGRRAS